MQGIRIPVQWQTRPINTPQPIPLGCSFNQRSLHLNVGWISKELESISVLYQNVGVVCVLHGQEYCGVQQAALGVGFRWQMLLDAFSIIVVSPSLKLIHIESPAVTRLGHLQLIYIEGAYNGSASNQISRLIFIIVATRRLLPRPHPRHHLHSHP